MFESFACLVLRPSFCTVKKDKRINWLEYALGKHGSYPPTGIFGPDSSDGSGGVNYWPDFRMKCRTCLVLANPRWSAVSGVCQVKAGHVFTVRCYYHLQLMKARVYWKTKPEETSVARKKKRRKAVGKVKQDIREIGTFCHMVHIAITFISYFLSGILLKRVNNINPTGIYP